MGFQRCPAVRINAQELTAFRDVSRDVTVTTDPARLGLHHKRGKRGRYHRIKRVSPLAHDAHPRLGRERVTGGADTVTRLELGMGINGGFVEFQYWKHSYPTTQIEQSRVVGGWFNVFLAIHGAKFLPR